MDYNLQEKAWMLCIIMKGISPIMIQRKFKISFQEAEKLSEIIKEKYKVFCIKDIR